MTIIADRRRAAARFVALNLADGLRRDAVFPNGARPRAVDEETQREIRQAAGPFISEGEIAFATELCIRTIERVSGAMEEFAPDIAEAWEAHGKDGVRAALETCSRELQAELCRAFLKIAYEGPDDG